MVGGKSSARTLPTGLLTYQYHGKSQPPDDSEVEAEGQPEFIQPHPLHYRALDVTYPEPRSKGVRSEKQTRSSLKSELVAQPGQELSLSAGPTPHQHISGGLNLPSKKPGGETFVLTPDQPVLE